jgi:hypothetical protein
VIDFLLDNLTPQRWIALQAAFVGVLLLGIAYNLGRMRS